MRFGLINSDVALFGSMSLQDLSAALPQGQVCHDEERLEVIFGDLARHRDDSQQRSWALHEDHALIACYLEELLKILVQYDGPVSGFLAACAKNRSISSNRCINLLVLTLLVMQHSSCRMSIYLEKDTFPSDNLAKLDFTSLMNV